MTASSAGGDRTTLPLTKLPAPRRTYCSLAFYGIHVISSRIFPLLTEAGVFPIIPAYLRLAAQGEKILGFRADEYDWKDLGTPENLTAAAALNAGILPR